MFRSPDCFFAPNYERKGKTYDDFVAPIFMSEEEMIAMGKAAVRKLGYSEKILPLTNRVHAAGGPNRQTKPDLSRFYFQWDNSSEDNPYPLPVVGCEIDGSTKTLKSLFLNHKDLWHSPPAIDVPPN